MSAVLSPVDGVMTVLLTGEIDHHTAAALREEIDAAVETHQPRLLTLDFGGVSFMDSSGIGLVMGRYKLVSAYGGKVAIANVPRPMRRVMRLAGLDRLAEMEHNGGTSQ
ncbi:MAG: anti-anti-sigma factor [Oscillospiraceae bacterium]|nr:MAG: anti-anti-sigma factor [Oscillospiraceae bacterium]